MAQPSQEGREGGSEPLSHLVEKPDAHEGGSLDNRAELELGEVGGVAGGQVEEEHAVGGGFHGASVGCSHPKKDSDHGRVVPLQASKGEQGESRGSRGGLKSASA